MLLGARRAARLVRDGRLAAVSAESAILGSLPFLSSADASALPAIWGLASLPVVLGSCLPLGREFGWVELLAALRFLGRGSEGIFPLSSFGTARFHSPREIEYELPSSSFHPRVRGNLPVLLGDDAAPRSIPA